MSVHRAQEDIITAHESEQAAAERVPAPIQIGDLSPARFVEVPDNLSNGPHVGEVWQSPLHESVDLVHKPSGELNSLPCLGDWLVDPVVLEVRDVLSGDGNVPWRQQWNLDHAGIVPVGASQGPLRRVKVLHVAGHGPI